MKLRVQFTIIMLTVLILFLPLSRINADDKQTISVELSASVANYSEYQFNVRANVETTDGAITNFVYMWKVDDGELTAFIPRGDLWEFVQADQDIFIDAPMVHWDLPGPGIYKITCIAGNVGYASGTASITIEIPEFYEVEA